MPRTLRPLTLALAVSLALPVFVHPALAQDADSAALAREQVEVMHETTQNLVRLLVEQGVIKQDAADAMFARAEASARQKLARFAAATSTPAVPEPAPLKPGVVRVQYVPETVKRELREQLRQEVVAQAKQERWGDVNAVPAWVSRIKLEGDLRLRFQGDFLSASNAPEAAFQAIGQNVSNTLEDRTRARYRLRLGVGAEVAPGYDVGARLASGSAADPVSTNQTLGASFAKNNLAVDRAFLRVTAIPGLTLTGGRIPNPFFATDLVWDDDLNFEGAAASYTLWAQENRSFTPSITVGAFPLQEIEQRADTLAEDKWLIAGQLGASWTPDARTRLKGGLAYYQYRDIAGVRNPLLNDTRYNATAPQTRQKGNTLFNIDNDGNPATNLWALAADYRLLNATLVADFARFDPVHVIATLDWAKNVGFDAAKTLARAGFAPEDQTDAWQARLTVGHPQVAARGDWQATLGYRYLEADAVLDAYTDSDFHLGGTNHKGWFVGGVYGLEKNAALAARWMSSDQISGLPLAVDVFQLDLNAKF